MATKSLIRRLSDRIEALEDTINPRLDIASVLLCEELVELLGEKRSCEVLRARYEQRHPEYRRAKQWVFIRSFVPRCDKTLKDTDPIGFELLCELRAEEQRKHALLFWDVPPSTLPQ
jgi:hypothetical protein